MDDPGDFTRYVTVACYIRLLSIYRALVVALYQDVLSSDIGKGTAPSLVEIRLVLLVQFITHLLDCLSKAMRDYVSLFNRQQHVRRVRSEHLSESMQKSPDGNDTGLEAATKLEYDVKDELKKLQICFQRP